MSQILRIAIAGSVDDGKSTLLGRLLHDTGSLRVDQISKMKKVGASKGLQIDLASVTDGLKAEQEQGITIDVAYRYLDLAGRRVIFADTPGHEQYTRNMFTGASSAWASLLLVDAVRGLRDQTRRHSAIAALQGHQHLVFCINKLDAVEYSQTRFEELAAQCQTLADQLGIKQITLLPVAALNGANVVERHPSLAWFKGPTLLETLQSLSAQATHNAPSPISIQSVLTEHDQGQTQRLLSLRFSGQPLKVGDALQDAHGNSLSIKRAFAGGQEVETLQAGLDALIEIDREVDLTRGDWLFRQPPELSNRLDVTLCWLGQQIGQTRQNVVVRHGDQWIRGRILEASPAIDLANLCYHESYESMTPNSLHRVQIQLAKSVPVSAFDQDPVSGSCILVDPVTDQTLAAGVINSNMFTQEP